MLFGCQTSGSRCYIQARTIAESNNYLTLNPNGGNVGIGLAVPSQKLDVFGKSVFGSDSTFNVLIHLGSVLYNFNQNFAKNCMYHDTTVNPYGLFIANTNNGNVANKEASILFGIADTANNVKTGISICALANDVNVVSSDLVFKTKAISPNQNGYDLCSESMRITSNGDVGVGGYPATAKLHIEGSQIRGLIRGFNAYWDAEHTYGFSNGASFFNCRYDGTPIGDIYQASTSSININYSSDYRLKENVVEMPSMIDKIKKLRPVQFNFLEDPQDSLGFIAHEFKELFPNNCIVKGKKDAMKCECKNCKKPEGVCECKEEDCCLEMIPDYMGMDYGKVTPICIKGIQELITENEKMKNEIFELKENQKKIINKLNSLIDPSGWFQNSI